MHRLSLLVLSLTVLSRIATAETLSLGQEDAVALTLERHPAMEAAEQGARAAELKASQADSAWLPRLTFEASYRFQGPVPTLRIEVPIPNPAQPTVLEREAGNEHNASAALKAGWRAWDFGARDVRAAAADAAARARRAEGDERAVDLAAAARASYLAVAFFAGVEDITARSLETTRQELAEQRIRRDAGIESDVGVAGVEARVAELEARLVDAQQSRLRATNDLRLLLGVPEPTVLQLTDSLERLAGSPAADPAAAHPSLARLASLEEAVRLERRSVGRAYLPTLDVFGTAAYQYPETFFETDQAGLVYSAGAVLTWDLFDGDLKRRQRAELEARAAEVSALAQAARQDITRRTAEAESRLASAAASIDAATRTLEASETYQRAAVASHKAGTGTELDVRKAEEAVDRAHMALLKARFDAALARAELARARGVTLSAPRAGRTR